METIDTKTRFVTLFRPDSEDTAHIWRVHAMVGTDVIGSVRVRQMRECVAIGVAFALHVREDYRRQGIARLLMQAMERCALSNGMTLILSTIREDNPASQSLVTSMEYVQRDAFHNPKSDADVRLYSKSL